VRALFHSHARRKSHWIAASVRSLATTSHGVQDQCAVSDRNLVLPTTYPAIPISKDIAAEILVLGQLGKVFVDIFHVNDHRFAGVLVGIEGQMFE